MFLHRSLIVAAALVAIAAPAGAQYRIGRIISQSPVPPVNAPVFLPIGNGSVATWTANGAATVWDSVDDSADNPDEAVTYASRSNSAGDHCFTFSNPAVPGGSTINRVVVATRERNNGSSVATFRHAIRVGASNFYFSAGANLTSSFFASSSTTWIANPKTGLAWTVNDVNGVGSNTLAEACISATGMESGDRIDVTQVYLIIDYVPGGGGGTIPAAASGFSPADNATNVPINVTLSCAQQADATSYRMFFSTTSPVALTPTNELTLQDPTVCSYNMIGMANSDEVFWVVCPVNGFGENCSAAEQSFTTVASGNELTLVAAAANCPNPAHNSPPGRNPRLGWRCDKQAVWNQMYADFLAVCPSATAGISCSATPTTLGGKWFKVVKQYCDSAVGATYGDFGQWCGMIYQWTGDAGYVTGANGFWAKIQPGYFAAAPHADGNVSRIKTGMMTIMAEWTFPALTSPQWSQLIGEIDGDNDYGRLTTFKGSFPWNDSDQLIGQCYLPVAMMHVILPNNASNELLYNDSEMGGLVSTSAVPKSTARNTITTYMNMAAGGEFIEAPEYDLETVPWFLVMVEAINDALGVDNFTDVTSWIPGFADRILATITPDKLRYIQYADEEKPDIWETFKVANATTAVAGVLKGTAKGQQMQQFVLDLVTQYGATGSGSMQPEIRWWGMMVFDPYQTPADWKTSKTYHASGEGLGVIRTGWTASDAMFFTHGAPKYPEPIVGYFHVDHQAWYMADFQTYRAGEWIDHHPFGYASASTYGEANNVLRLNGMTQAREYVKIRGLSYADTHFYQSLTSGGSHVGKPSTPTYPGGYYNPPTVHTNELTADVLHIPGEILTTITYHRAYELAMSSTNLTRYGAGGCPQYTQLINERHAQQEYIHHIPVAPTVSGNVFTWLTPKTSQQAQWTALVPELATRTVYDLNTTFAQGLSSGARCGWSLFTTSTKYSVDTAPYNWKLVKIWPTTMGEWHTYLNVFQFSRAAPAAAPLTPILVKNNNMECAFISTPAQSDTLSCFNAIQGPDLVDTTYDPSHATVLDSVRLRPASAGPVTLNVTTTSTALVFYITHLNPANTWTYTIDGGSPVSIPSAGGTGLTATGGFARIPLTVTIGAHTIVVSGS